MCDKSWACCLVMNCGVMFCHFSHHFFFAWGPVAVVSKLSSTLSVAEPMIFHVHYFQFLDDAVVDNAKCCGVVRLHGVGGWGWPMNSRVWQMGMVSLKFM